MTYNYINPFLGANKKKEYMKERYNMISFPQENKQYITYFQTVTTVGVVTDANSEMLAEKLAEDKLKEEGIACGLVSHSPLSPTETEEYDYMFHIKNDIMEKIASRLNKPVNSLTGSDCSAFLENVLEENLG
jgi:hypothetical protein